MNVCLFLCLSLLLSLSLSLSLSVCLCVWVVCVWSVCVHDSQRQVMICDKTGKSCLHWAVSDGNPEIGPCTYTHTHNTHTHTHTHTSTMHHSSAIDS